MQRHLIEVFRVALVVASSSWMLAAPASAQTYKWKDAEGKVHYSDQPPPESAREQATVKPRKPSSPAAVEAPAGTVPTAKAKTYIEQEAEFKKRRVETAEREAAEQKKLAEAAERKQNCEQARAQVRSLQAGGRVTRTNAQGEREYMNDAQVAQEVDRATKAVASWCN